MLADRLPAVVVNAASTRSARQKHQAMESIVMADLCKLPAGWHCG